MNNNSTIYCRSDDGITIGLIDSIISIARVLSPRLMVEQYPNPEIIEALKDLHQDEDLYNCLKIHVFNKRILSEDDANNMEQIRKAHELLKEKGIIKQ